MDFSRLDEHSQMNASGTGLGLSICKKMIEQMGGTVTVDSVLGEGTAFKVDLQTKALRPIEARIEEEKVLEDSHEMIMNQQAPSSRALRS